MTTIRSFDPGGEIDWLHSLWHQALSSQWAIDAPALKQRISTSQIALTARLDGGRVGFCAVSYAPSGSAALQVILVHPSCRRLGVGAALVEGVKQILLQHGVTSLSLGYEGSGDYFWPGVPESESEAWNFFSTYGWARQGQSFDLLIDLATYQTPAWVADRLDASGTTLHLATPETAASIVQFEQCNFPAWAGYYENAFRLGKFRNVLFARAVHGGVTGTALLNGNEQVTWHRALGYRCGSFAVLGVAKEQEGKGIGTALAARSAEIVQERGCSACYIDWTGLVSWYGKLGATVWSEYRSGTKVLLGEDRLPTVSTCEPSIPLRLAPAGQGAVLPVHSSPPQDTFGDLK